MKITQGQLAEKSGLSLDTISRYETGKRSPRVTDLEKIASALGRSLAELLAGNTHASMDMAEGQDIITRTLSAWKETSEAAEAMAPMIIADGISPDELRNIHKEAKEAHSSLARLIEKIEPMLAAV